MFARIFSMVQSRALADVELGASQKLAYAWQQPDFYALYVAVQSNVASAEQKPALQAFGLAVRRQFRHWCIEDRVKLIVESSEATLRLYGGFFAVRQADGTVKTNIPGCEHCSVNDFPRVIFAGVTRHLNRELYDRLETIFTRQAEQAGLAGKELRSAQSYFEELVTWVLRKFKVPLWSRKTTDAVLVKTIAKALWDNAILDKAAFGMGVRARGFRRLLVRDYNKIVLALPQMQERQRETPNLVPLLQPLLTLEHRHLAVQQLREQFLANGGTPAGWRWLARQSLTFIQSQTGGAIDDTERNAFFSLLAASQVGRLPGSPKLALQRYLFSGFYLRDNGAHAQRRDNYVTMLRLFSRAYESRKVKVRDLLHQLPLVWDFVSSTNPKGSSLAKATWISLFRRQAEWHRSEARKRREADKAQRGLYYWAPLTENLGYQDYVAISLNTSDALWEEGDEMSHCVGGYAQACFQNRSRIYSLQTTTGDRVATLEIQDGPRGWQQTQLYGPNNSRVTNKAVISLAKKVVFAAKKAKPLLLSENQVLRMPQTGRPAAALAAPAAEFHFDFTEDMIPF